MDMSRTASSMYRSMHPSTESETEGVWCGCPYARRSQPRLGEHRSPTLSRSYRDTTPENDQKAAGRVRGVFIAFASLLRLLQCNALHTHTGETIRSRAGSGPVCLVSSLALGERMAGYCAVRVQVHSSWALPGLDSCNLDADFVTGWELGSHHSY